MHDEAKTIESVIDEMAHLQGHELNGRDHLMVRNRVGLLGCERTPPAKDGCQTVSMEKAGKAKVINPTYQSTGLCSGAFLFVRAIVYKHMYKQNKKGASPCRLAPF
jgi:hypothetical protein